MRRPVHRGNNVSQQPARTGTAGPTRPCANPGTNSWTPALAGAAVLSLWALQLLVGRRAPPRAPRGLAPSLPAPVLHCARHLVAAFQAGQRGLVGRLCPNKLLHFLRRDKRSPILGAAPWCCHIVALAVEDAEEIPVHRSRDAVYQWR